MSDSLQKRRKSSQSSRKQSTSKDTPMLKKVKSDVSTKVMNDTLKFTVHKQYKKIRASTMVLPHGPVNTPIFMPVGTKGTIKGLTSQEMESLDCWLLLGNTYHLASKPGTDYLERFGGLHKFMNWKRNILTDSGGFQMVSLSKLCEITEEGVHFTNPYDEEKKIFLRPEDSIHAQNQIGSDIMMALDDVVKTTTEGPRMEEAMHRTCRWIHRNFEAHEKPESQNLFPITQGGLNLELRGKCLEEFSKLDAKGFAIGGLSGGEEKEDFIRIVAFSAEKLAKDKPRYLMGVGFPEDCLLCACLGVDMFDCVYPTRTARFGTAFGKTGNIKLKNAKYKYDYRPIVEGCECECCQNYTRAYLHTIAGHEEVAGM